MTRKQPPKSKIMKIKILLLMAVIGIAGAAWWYQQGRAAPVSAATGRAALYYTCAMHPWVREKQPGPCPVCGMNLTPVFENQSGGTGGTMETNSGMVTLESESISTINVQTDLVERRALRHTIHVAGEITGNSRSAAWFEFIVYERDLPWFKTGQTFQIVVPAAPGKRYSATIEAHGVKAFVDENLDMMTGSTTLRAEIANPPVEAGDLGGHKLFNNLHAEAHVVAETEPVLTVPRSAVIWRGSASLAYVDKGDGHYAPRAILLGRMGDEFAEVLGGLKEGEKVVTNGNVLIDSEAQLTAGE
jgi:multidrug efflux pump subunit AcrA (membrane-fusion protein)